MYNPSNCISLMDDDDGGGGSIRAEIYHRKYNVK